jgi:6-phosphogluconolactonase (cycloisomerase 2 family)
MAFFAWSLVEPQELIVRQHTDQPQLVSIEQLPDYGNMCEMPEMRPSSLTLLAEANRREMEEGLVYAQNGTTDVTRPPVRTIRDTYPIYSSVAVDAIRDEVVLQDNNLWATAVFRRTENTTPNGPPATPERLIRGELTDIQFNNGLYIDPEVGDIYSVESDTGDKIVIFSNDAIGNVAPKRHLETPHRGYAIAVDEDKDELFVSVEYPPQVAVYRKHAEGAEKPLRQLMGDNTELNAIHGLAVDSKNRLLYVNNWGNFSNFRIPGTGKFLPPSITVYPLDAKGDMPPLRKIQGEKTQMNWPAGMQINLETNELYIANDVGNSILVFDASAEGDVAPKRVIKGLQTGLVNPTGVSLDLKNREVWAANLGNSTATVYPLNANGDIAPLRIIRSAPVGYRSTKFGKTEAVAYDTRREEYLIPNCVNHPQIAAFSRMAGENTAPTRTLQGQRTLISRTMHDIQYDPSHDEIVVNSPLTQAVLVFDGGANGEEPPKRFIQGPKTKILGVGAMDKVSVDPSNGDIYLPVATREILVFPHGSQGDVAPARIIGGPDTQMIFTPQTTGGGNVPPIRIDPDRKLLVVPSLGEPGKGRALLIFDQYASGNVKPLRVIQGPKTMIAGSQQIAISPQGWIVGGATNNSIGVWNIMDNGDVAPRWRIPVRQISGLNVNGIALNHRDKELMVPTGNGNTVMTFYFPEIF